jgi:hypothetical protein
LRFKVYLLRQRGRRLSWREAQNGPTYVGRLVTHSEEHGGERYSVTRIQPDDPMASGSMPELYEAVLLGFAPIAFRLRGFERVGQGGDAYSVVQEWHCELP